MTRQEVEAYLKSGTLYAHMRNGNWWKLRRNGQTKLWKTRPGEYRIPVKAGLTSCGYITHDNANDTNLFKVEA